MSLRLTPEQPDLINRPPEQIPLEDMQSLVSSVSLRHVAIIMDGNRRWAQTRRLPKTAGHFQGVEALRKVVRQASDIGLQALTVYAFSTENWSRGSEEVGFLMDLFVQVLTVEIDRLHAQNVQVRIIGDTSAFSSKLQDLIRKAETTTRNNTGLRFQIAMNYGARAELVQAMRRIAAEVAEGRLSPPDIQGEHVDQALYTQSLPDPDLLIRTGGESRLSNFLLWQCAYAEFYVTRLMWPEFNEVELNRAVLEFVRRERRFGR
jgi:undecaprenyl diphosphate synthase